MSTSVITPNSVWVDKYKYDDAERIYHEKASLGGTGSSKLIAEITKAREQIKSSLQNVDGVVNALTNKSGIRSESSEGFDALKTKYDKLAEIVSKMEKRIDSLEKQLKAATISQSPAAGAASASAPSASKKKEGKDGAGDSDVDLFGSESEDEEADKVREQRLAEYAAKKSKKPALVAKSNIILDVKPWDDETDMVQMEERVRKVECDGLKWGASKLVPLAYGIKKLQISCVVEDDKVSVDWLQETIEEIEDLVQSVDIAAFNKV